jgi:hypothetical protein
MSMYILAAMHDTGFSTVDQYISSELDRLIANSLVWLINLIEDKTRLVAFETGSWISLKHAFAFKGRQYGKMIIHLDQLSAHVYRERTLSPDPKGNELQRDRTLPEYGPCYAGPPITCFNTGTKKDGAPGLCASTFHFATS